MPHPALPPEPPTTIVSSPHSEATLRRGDRTLATPTPPSALPQRTRNDLIAQAVVPAADGVGTTVTPEGNRFDLGGGQRSGDGANLFHSLSQFGLSQGQIANFLSSPEIRNILTRVVGGEPSIINGTIQVTGGLSNLFLINPAGILFGPAASLNVPAAFTATTATTIGFGDREFNVFGSNSYTLLQGPPTHLGFVLPQARAIVNAGNLAVNSGQTLNLIGGTVINTGQLRAPGGEITVASVPGTSLVRLSQTGTLLSLEFQPSSALASSPPTLPELLTGGNQANATGIHVNQQGEVLLTGSQAPILAAPGTTIVAGQVDVSGPLGGRVQVLGDRVGLVGAAVQASGNSGGGTVLVGGDVRGQGTVPNASQVYVSPDSRIQADALQTGNGGSVTLWSNDATAFYGSITARSAMGNGGTVEVSGRQALGFQGSVDLSAPNGSVGTLLLDPTNIQIVAGGSGAQDPFLPNIPFSAGPPDTFTLSQNALQSQAAAVTLEATNNITIAPGVSLNFAAGTGAITFRADADNSGAGSFSMDPSQTIRAAGRNLAISGANLTLGTLDTSSIAPTAATSGSVNLTATNTLTAGAILTSAASSTAGTATAGAVTVNAGSMTLTGPIVTTATTLTGGSTATGGNVTLTTNSGDLVFNSIATNGSGALVSTSGNVQLLAAGAVRGTASGDTISTASSIAGGTISIQHSGGSTNAPFIVGDASVNGTAGALNAGSGSVISPVGVFPVQSIGGSDAVGRITITSVNQAPTLVTNPLPSVVQNQPLTFTFADLVQSVGDLNGDATSVIVSAVNSGTLLVNGNAVTPGVTTIGPGDTLVYLPASNATGTITNAFTVQASDGVARSPVSSGQISLTIGSTPNNPDGTGNPISGDAVNPTPLSFGNQLSSVLLNQTPPAQPDLGAGASALSNLACTDTGVDAIENQFTREYEAYAGKPSEERTTLLDACNALRATETSTGVKPAIVYVRFAPNSLVAGDTDALELVVVTPTGRPLYKRVGVTRAQVLAVARQFANDLTDPATRDTDAFLPAAQQLYRWLVQPLVADLQTRKVSNLTFITDAGLRSLPIAALHDGQKFLLESYSLSIMPSLSITDTRYRSLKQSQVLAMGASQFTDQRPLPAVPLELASVLQPWVGQSFLNEAFTLNNLKAQRQQQPFGIVHLATHAEFNPGSPQNSFIQLWDTKLRLSDVRQAGLSNPPVELLVLSACRTALGDVQAELGFAGLAYQLGVRSILASLWAVDDEGTLALMSEFYPRLKQAPIKADALRQAQLAMIRKQVRIEQGGLVTTTGRIPLPGDLAQSSKDLSYPFYWAAFTLVGNPW